MTDAELVLRARGGDQIAAQQLVRRHRRLAKMHALDYFAPGLERDDLIAEGLLGLAKAIRDYRSDRDSGFRNFADICVKRQIITAVKGATRKKHKPLNHAASLDAPLKGDEDGGCLGELLPSSSRGPVEVLAAEEEAVSITAAFDLLTPLEDRSIRGIADGTAYVEIAERLGVGEKAVNNAAQRARSKLAAALGTEPAAA